jgi:hypothetical protein
MTGASANDRKVDTEACFPSLVLMLIICIIHGNPYRSIWCDNSCQATQEPSGGVWQRLTSVLIY